MATIRATGFDKELRKISVHTKFHISYLYFLMFIITYRFPCILIYKTFSWILALMLISSLPMQFLFF